MFHFHLVTLFPEVFASFLATSLMGKAVESGLIRVSFHDPREHTTDRHRTVDDAPFGGGDGMVIKPEPVVAALEAVPGRPHRVMLTPQGQPLTQRVLEDLAGRGELVLLCGRYEGFDERVRAHVDREISLCDGVLGGGEVPAMAVMEGVARLVPGVIGNPGSLRSESHAGTLLEYPQYTRPREFRGEQVPEILLSGDHARVDRWRREQMLRRTRERRPDLWERHALSSEDIEILEQSGDTAATAGLAARTSIALLHHPVRNRRGETVTTAVTNLDLHDIARSSRTYGLHAYFVVTPLTSQQELVSRITEHWRTGYGARTNPPRREALSLLRVEPHLGTVIDALEHELGERPLTVVTSAVRRPGQKTVRAVKDAAGARPGRPLLLLLGTGWGLTDDALALSDLALEPVSGPTDYNHLSVRSAAAIVLDRFFGLGH